MIRTINEQYRAYKRLRDLAAKVQMRRRERLLQLARMVLALATAQLRDPEFRPKARLSADQYRAIAEYLLANPDTATRGRRFAGLAKIAEREDWPCSATGPFQVLTKEESSGIWNGPFALSQRVFAPYLTASQQAALRKDLKEMTEWAMKTFNTQSSESGDRR
jgi:hypothetical protein